MTESKEACTTENGAISYPDTLDNCVNLFFKTVRGLNEDTLRQLLEDSWSTSPEATLRIIFQTRDCRGGKGERLLFVQALKWLQEKNPDSVKANIGLVPFYGVWKDLLEIALTIHELEDDVIELFASQLLEDRRLLEENRANGNNENKISLCAKWAPSERHHYDTSRLLAKKIAHKLCGSSNNLSRYRKEFLVPLREALKVTEVYMCARLWGEIPYSLVASRCMHRGKNVFFKHDGDRFSSFIEAALQGKAKIQGKQMYPHELIKPLMRSSQRDCVAECQWNVLVNEARQLGSLNKSIALSDVSGSMSGVPMEVAIALGLLISELNTGPFANMIITFTETPTFHEVTQEFLHEKVRALQNSPQGFSTNFAAALEMILDMAKDQNVAQEDMPDKLFVFSDMQFNEADSNYKTNHENLVAKFKEAGYEVPMIIYWNVRANTTDFPALSDTPGVALLAGYSPSLMKVVMDGCDVGAPVIGEDGTVQPAKPEGPTPRDILMKVLNDPRYDGLQLKW